MAEHLDDFEDISAERIRSIQEDFDALSLDPDAEAVSRRESDLLSLGGEEGDSFGDSVDSLEDDFEKVSRKTAGNSGRRRKNMTEQYLDNLTELDEDAKDQAEVEIHNPVADEVRAKAARPAGYDERDRRGRRRPERYEEDDRRRRGGRPERGEEDDRPRKRSGGGFGRVLMIILLILLAAALGVGGFFLWQHTQKTAFYRSHFLPYTTINGLACGDKTIEETKDILAEQVEAYTLSISGRSEDVTMTGSDADMVMNFDVDLQELLDQQKHGSYYQMNEETGNRYTVASAVTMDDEKLRESVKALEIFQNMTETREAAVRFDNASSLYILEEAVQGTKVDVDAVADRIVECYHELAPALDLEAEGFYTSAGETPQAMRDGVENANQYLRSSITLTFDEAGSEALPGETLASCIVMDESTGAVTFDSNPIALWLDTVADKYDSMASSYPFTTTAGNEISVDGGSYGWQMNREETLAAIVTAVNAGESISQEPVYTHRAFRHVTGEDGSMVAGIGNTYIEADLTNQRLHYYKDGEAVLDTALVSGDVQAGHATPNGVYPILRKIGEPEVTSDAAVTEKDVKYWMAFSDTAGICDDASRQYFGGSEYLTEGSQGSILISPEMAAALFEQVEPGTPVVIYGGVSTYATEAETTRAAATTKAQEREEDDSEESTQASSEEDTTRADQPTEDTGEETRQEESSRDETQGNSEEETRDSGEETQGEDVTKTPEEDTTKAAEDEPVTKEEEPTEKSQEEETKATEKQEEPETRAPETNAPETKAPEPESKEPETRAPETKKETEAEKKEPEENTKKAEESEE